MGLVIHFFQLLESGVGVDFCGGQALMSEQFLDGLQVGIVVEHCCGKRVAEHMWAVALLCCDHRQVLLDDASDFYRCHTVSASFVQEEVCALHAVLGGEVITLCEVASQAVAVLIAVRDDALLISLPCDLELHLIQIDILVCKADELGEPYARSIECEQNHAVALTDVVRTEEVSVEEAVHLCLADVGGQLLLSLRPLHVVDRVAGDEASPQQELVEGAEGTEASLYACGDVAAIHHLHYPLSHYVDRHVFPSQVIVQCFIEPLERLQVGLVFFDGSRRIVTLVSKVFYEVFYPIHALRLLFLLRR